MLDMCLLYNIYGVQPSSWRAVWFHCSMTEETETPSGLFVLLLQRQDNHNTSWTHSGLFSMELAHFIFNVLSHESACQKTWISCWVFDITSAKVSEGCKSSANQHVSLERKSGSERTDGNEQIKREREDRVNKAIGEISGVISSENSSEQSFYKRQALNYSSGCSAGKPTGGETCWWRARSSGGVGCNFTLSISLWLRWSYELVQATHTHDGTV